MKWGNPLSLGNINNECKMEYNMILLNELRKNKLNNRESILQFFQDESNYEKIGLRELKPEICEECRVRESLTDGERYKFNGENPKNPFYAENCVIKFDGELKLKDFDCIRISNSVVIGNLFLWMLPDGIRSSSASIVLDNVIVLGNVRILLFPGIIDKIHIGATAVDNLDIRGDAHCESFSLDESSVGRITFYDVEMQDVEISDSEIGAIRIKDKVVIKQKRLIRSKIDMNKTFDLDQKYSQWLYLPKNPFGHNYDKTITEAEIEEKELTFKKTCEFITSFPSGLSLKDRAVIANKKLFHDHKKRTAYAYKFFDFILNPYIVLALIFFIVVACAVVYAGRPFYYSNLELTNKLINIDFWQALYYSAVSFTTIGYGEFTSPDKWVRILSTLEGLIGVLGGGAFLVALTRKYLDFNDKRG